MKRSQFIVLTLLLSVALFAGVLVGAMIPPLGTASAQELKLAAAPTGTQAVVVPSFADLAERAIPGLVHIERQSSAENADGGESGSGSDAIPEPFRKFFEREAPDDETHRGPNRKKSRPEVATGSGFFFTGDGYIMTNRHVVQGAEKLFVNTATERDLPAKIVGIDPHMDLAVIKVQPTKPITPLVLGDSDALRVGEWVMAIGNPLEYTNSVTVGVVSGKERRGFGLQQDANDVADYIQTDAAINFGNSGGPLINARGEVIGINTQIVRSSGNPYEQGLVEGIGFALPITQCKQVVEQLIKTGTVKRGQLGIIVGPLDPRTMAYYHLDSDRGALVTSVREGSPAENAGVKREDVILNVEGRSIRDSGDLVRVISSYAPGDKVKLHLLRDGKPLDIVVSLGTRGELDENDEPRRAEQKAPEENDSGDASALGFTVMPMPPEMRERFEKSGIRGVVIKDVEGDSDAAREGITPGLMVTEVNRIPTPNLEEFKRAVAQVKPGQVVKLHVYDRTKQDALIYFYAPKE